MDVIPRKGRDGGLEGCDTTDSSRSGETVVSRCIAAALATGVNCVLDEEYSASREAGRITGISAVSTNAVMPQQGMWYGMACSSYERLTRY